MREDWIELPYKNVVDKISTTKQKLKQKEYLQEGKIAVVDQGQKQIGGYTNDDSKILNCELPVIVFGDHTKIVKIITFPFASGADGTKVLQPKKFIDAKLLANFTKILVHKISDKGYARHYQHIEKQNIQIPPLPIQRAIVSKIEELFSSLDSGIADLKEAQEQLKVYRQAVLKKAFEGELTKEWRALRLRSGNALPDTEDLLKQIKEERQSHYNKQIEDWKKAVKTWEENGKDGKKPSKPKAMKELPPLTEEDLKELPKIPVGWCWIMFSQICTLQRGYDLPIKNIIDGKYPVISSGGIAGYHNKFRANGPALITGRSGGVGNIHFLEVEKYWPHNTVLHVKDFYGNHPKFLYYFFKQFDFKSHSASTAVPTLDRKNLYKIPVRNCSKKEQHQIVQEIETRLSVCDKVEKILAQEIERSQNLRQSILKKAFEGRLLSEAEITACKQEKDYEPASVLLARIERSRNDKIKAEILQQA